MQSLYYKGSSKHILIGIERAELEELRVRHKRREREEKIQTNKEEHYNINKE